MPWFSLTALNTAVHSHELNGKIFVLDQRFVLSLATCQHLYIVYLNIFEDGFPGKKIKVQIHIVCIFFSLMQ